MIQRRQTLYLLAVVILGVILYFCPVIRFTTPEDGGVQREFILSAQGLEEEDLGLEFDDLQPLAVKGLWGITVISLLIPILALVDIFLFKKRILQARLNILTSVVCLGYYGMVYMYVWYICRANRDLNLEWYVSFGACLPLVCLVLVIGATRFILKDEMMVRAADRIR